MIRSQIQLSLNITGLLGLAAFGYFSLVNKQVVVYIDTAKLINNYQGMQDARTSFQQKSALWQANIDTLAAELSKSQEAFKQEEPKMSVKEKELSIALIRTKQQQLKDYQAAIGEKASQEDSRITSQVIGQINLFLESYGEKNGYEIIIGATAYGNLAYAKERLDITDQVLTRLNQEYVGS